MKKIISYSLIFLFVIVLSLFINIKTSDKIVVHASGPKILQENTYLTFESTSSFILETSDNTKLWNGTLYYSTDTTTWNVWDGITTLSSVDNKLYLRGTGNTEITSYGESWDLRSPTGSNIECIGNIENLLDYETVALGNHPTMANSCFANMFAGCTSLTTAPSLPATTLAPSCYYYMFDGCTGLTTAPQLPATTLANNCYSGMFRGCTGLTTAPSLPATTLVSDCYQYMFRGCTSLTTAPSLPATTLAPKCYFRMFYGCTALKVSTTKTGSYQYAWRIPTSGAGTTATDWNTDMLYNTGGTFKGNPTINTTYYVENPPVSGSGFNITFEENGGTTIPDIEGVTELPTLPTPTRSGYTFLGWYYDSSFTNAAVAGDTIESDVTLYAKWQLNTYTITFNSNGGSSVPSISDVTALPDTLPIPTRTGYYFQGWFYDSDFNNEAQPGDSLSTDVTLYAMWTQYNRIFFNTNGGNTIPSIITTDIIPDNLPIPERNDDIFIGWYYDESLSVPVESNGIISSNITLYASWIDYDGIIEYFNDIYMEGFEEGYNDIYNDSYNQGYDLGLEYGYPYGYEDGYRDGLMEDHPFEFQEYFDKGYFDARDKYGKLIDDYQWESAQIAYENGQKAMGRYSRILMYGIVIITIIGGVLLYYSLKRRNE